MQDIKKLFNKMVKEYNQINNTNIKGSFREKNRNATISFGKYHIENGMIQDRYNNNHGKDESQWERLLQRNRNKFMCSNQFKDFINSTGAIYNEEDNVNWNVENNIVVMSKQIRFKF